MKPFFDYLEAISQVNDLGNGLKVQWLFHCGMLFLSSDKWWGDFKSRHCGHEGIDITYHRTQEGETKCFNDAIKVPAMDGGILLNICDDFLGQTLVVEHEKFSCADSRILFVYSHIIPEKSLKTGHSITKNQVIARVCNTVKNPQLPPHLHFSCLETSKSILPEDLNWTFFTTHPDIHLIHPVFL